MKARGEYPSGPGPFELSADELDNFRALWNERVVGSVAADLRAVDITPSLDPDSPDTARLEIPARGDKGSEYRCLLTVSSRGTWRPLPLIKPGELDQAILDASARLEDLRDDCYGDGVGSAELLREQLGDLDRQLMAIADRLDRCNPNSSDPGWLPIPDDETLIGFWSYVPAEDSRT